MKKLVVLFFLIFPLISCHLDRKSVKLERIIFHTSGCFGSCPIFHLEIDNKKNIKLFAEMVYQKGLPLVSEEDTAKTGYFKGTVNDTLYTQLDNILQTIGIENLNFNNSTCCDGSIKTIIIYYNGKRKYLKSMFPPERADTLISTLYKICTMNKLIRTKDKFDIEK